MRGSARILAGLGLAGLVALAAFLWAPRPLRSDNFLIYQPESRAALPVQVIDKVSYVPLLSVLNAVGKVGAIQEKRNSIKVWFGETEIEVKSNETRVRLGKARLDLAQPVRKPGSQWLVPVEFLTTVLPRLTKQQVEYRPGDNRIFLGDVRPVLLSVRLEPRSDGVRVAIQLSEKASFRTTSTDGKWYVFLGERPVQPAQAVFHVQDPQVSDIRFDDQDGRPKLIITPATGGLNFIPTVTEGGRVVLADILRPATIEPPAAPGPEQAQAPPPVAPSASTGTAGEEPLPGAPGPPQPVVVLDAAHGGDDPGARSRDGVLEKDLTAQLASRVRLALIAGRKFRIQLTRTGDVTTPFEQREVTTNTARPVVFLSFHAGNLGNTTPRVAVFTYRSVQAEEGAPPPLLVPWNEIHRIHAGQSQRLAQMLQARLAQIPGLAADPPVEAPVRSLRSVDCPAVAIEIGSLNPAQDAGAVTSVPLQQQIATAIVAGLEGFRAPGP
jgi:N-acetylmuramoyl-L-alanine amidase